MNQLNITITWIWNSKAPLAWRASKWIHNTYKKRMQDPQIDSLMVIAIFCFWARMHNSSRVAQDGGHAPANRLKETYSLGLQHHFLILHINVMVNRPFPSSLEPLHVFQSESNCESFVMVIAVLLSIWVKTHFHFKDFTLRLALK